MSGWGKDASTGVEWDYERRLKARDERIRELEQENERLRECVLACGEAVLCEGNWRDLPDMVLRSIVKYVRENARTAPRQSKSGAGEGGRGMSDCKHKWVGSAFDPIQCACCGMMLTAWQARRIRELEQRLAAVEGLPRYTHTTFCGAVPDSTGRWIKRDDLLAALQSAAASESNQTTNLMR